MTTGIKALRKTILGKEAVAGTAVAGTTILRGEGLLENQTEHVFPTEDVGYVSGVDRSYISQYAGAYSLPAMPATFEQINHIFEAGIQKVTTGAADGSGSGKIYTYNLPTTNACDMSSGTRVIQTYTIENGDNNEVEEMAYSFVESYTIEGTPGEALTIAAEWKGRQVVNSSFTTAATLPTVEEIFFNKGKIYIDTAGGTIGTTQITNTWLGFTLNVDTGLKAVQTGDGQLYFSFVKGVMPEVTMDVIFEHNGNASAQKTNWENGTALQIRAVFEGTAFAVAGTSYNVKTLIIDLAGKWESFGPLDEDDGNSVLTGTFRGRYNTTAALFHKYTLVNALTSVP